MSSTKKTSICLKSRIKYHFGSNGSMTTQILVGCTCTDCRVMHASWASYYYTVVHMKHLLNTARICQVMAGYLLAVVMATKSGPGLSPFPEVPGGGTWGRPPGYLNLLRT